jgi:RNA polymerase sigma-70 factor, ECF subfamily
MPLIHKLGNIDGIELSGEKDERIIRDNKWVEGLNRGDKDSFESIYKRYYTPLYNFLFRYTRSEEMIEDIIQEVFYNVWQNREKLEPRGTLKAYLFTAVRNQAFKKIESEKKYGSNDKELSDFEEINCVPPDGSCEFKELKKAYHEAVQKLPEKRRNIYLMHRQDNLTYNEIAEVLHISIKTVETQMSRSLKFLSIYLCKYR